MNIIPSIALLLRSEEVIDTYLTTQAMASHVCNGNRGINLVIANSGAVVGLIIIIGDIESDVPNLVALSKDFLWCETLIKLFWIPFLKLKM